MWAKAPLLHGSGAFVMSCRACPVLPGLHTLLTCNPGNSCPAPDMYA